LTLEERRVSVANWTTRIGAAAGGDADDAATVAPTVAPGAPPSLVGSRIGPYQVTKRLGAGGVGEVFKAVDLMLKRDVAIKVLRHELASDPLFLERFRREAQLHAKLCHANVAAVHAFVHEGDMQLMVMEFVPGVSLDEFIRAGGPVAVPRALALFRRVLDAIDHAHACGIVHRDIKPANIMLGDTGQVKVMDFGIARALDCQDHLTRHGHVAGTARAMAPEQIRGKPADVRSDIYSLGIVLYTLLAGRAPFDADSDFGLMKAQLEEPPPPLATFVPGVPAAVESAVMRALQKDPGQRFQTVATFARALDGSGARRAADATAERTGERTVAASAEAGADAATSRTTINPLLQGAQRLPAAQEASHRPPPRRAPARLPALRRMAIPAAAVAVLCVAAGAAWFVAREWPADLSAVAAASRSSAVPTERPADPPPRPEAAYRPADPAPAVAEQPLLVLELSLSSGQGGARADGAAHRFDAGDPIVVHVAASQAAHVYCYLQDESRRIVRFFPNRFSPSARVEANAPLTLPGAMPFELVANAQRIGETVACHASTRDPSAAGLPAAVLGTDFEPLPVASLDEISRAFASAGGSDAPVEKRRRVVFD
jgi:serine/threonine-protein kinase